jgi:hypothetical protein
LRRLHDRNSAGDASAFHKTKDLGVTKTDGYNRSATRELTTRPSGSTTTKKGLTGPVIRDCSERSPVLDKSPRNTVRFRIFGIATKIAATITDNRSKTILHELVRLTVPIGCRINRDFKWLPVISLKMRRTRSRTAFCDIRRGELPRFDRRVIAHQSSWRLDKAEELIVATCCHALCRLGLKDRAVNAPED